MKISVFCPICHKTICKIADDGELNKTFLWCRRCKKEIYIENIKNENKPESL